MWKKWVSFGLIVMMLLVAARAALASNEEYVFNNGSGDADVYAAVGDTYPVGKLTPGVMKKLLGTKTSGGYIWYQIDGGYVRKSNGVLVITVLVPELKATGASVKYGEVAQANAWVEDGEGYTVEYSADGGKWTREAPVRTTPGRTTVIIRATKEGQDTLSASVILEVGEKPSGATLTATGGTFPYDGKAHTVTYALVNADEYKNVYFSVDGGETWTKTAPSLTEVGTLTVTVRAVEAGGQEPLTVQVKLEVTESAASGSTVTIVNCSSFANVRAKASSSSKKVGEAKKGKTYKLLGVEGNWYKIQYSSSTVGYVFHSYAKVNKNESKPTDTPQPAGETCTIVNVNSAVNVRAQASSSSKKLGTAKNGDTFQVLGTTGHWVKVAYQGGVAYIYDYYVKLNGGAKPTPTPTPTPATSKAYIVNCQVEVNVRQKASSASRKLGVLKKGAEITVTGTSGQWTRIAYGGGTAYVYSEYVSYKKPDADVLGKTGTIVNVQYQVNVRAKASSASKLLGTAKLGETFTVKGVSGLWVKVDYHGETGYIYKRYMKIG